LLPLPPVGGGGAPPDLSPGRGQVTRRQTPARARGRQREPTAALAEDCHRGPARRVGEVADRGEHVLTPGEVEALTIAVDTTRAGEGQDQDFVGAALEAVRPTGSQVEDAQAGIPP